MEKNKKNIIIITIIIVVAVGAYLIGGVAKQHKKAPRNIGGMDVEKLFSSLDEGVAPEGPPQITGQFIAIDGEQVIVERVVGEMGDVEKKEAQSKMQALSDGGRQQMRDARRAERESAEKEKVFVELSDEVIIMKSTESDELAEVGIEELDENRSIMIWKGENGAIFILQNNIMRNNKS